MRSTGPNLLQQQPRSGVVAGGQQVVIMAVQTVQTDFNSEKVASMIPLAENCASCGVKLATADGAACFLTDIKLDSTPLRGYKGEAVGAFPNRFEAELSGEPPQQEQRRGSELRGVRNDNRVQVFQQRQVGRMVEHLRHGLSEMECSGPVEVTEHRATPGGAQRRPDSADLDPRFEPKMAVKNESIHPCQELRI